MTLGSLRLSRDDPHAWRVAAVGLFVAAAVVGVAIVVGGSAARAVNPIGAVLWVASGVVLALTLPEPRNQAAGWAATIASGFVLGAIVRPAEIGAAAFAFSLAGMFVVFAAGDRSGGWGLLAPAIYLPVHLVIGIGRAMLTDSGVRTDPPPTAALVPLSMLLGAVVGGMVGAVVLRRRT